MKFTDEIIHKLILSKGFKYYPEDKYLIKQILKYNREKNTRVLDVGCGNGHYSFLFEHYGAKVIAFDYNEKVIKKANEKKKEIGSEVQFLIADGRCPDKYFIDKFEIIFLCGFAPFGIKLNRELIQKYLQLLEKDGRLIFIHNSNLTGNLRKTSWRNHQIEELELFFKGSNCRIENIYFYDRHILIKLLHSFAFSELSKKMHIIISRISKLPCSLVVIVTNTKN